MAAGCDCSGLTAGGAGGECSNVTNSKDRGCSVSTCECSASAQAKVQLMVEEGIQGSTNLGGVPVVGKVYYSAQVSAEAAAKLTAGTDGVTATASADASASVTVGATASGDM